MTDLGIKKGYKSRSKPEYFADTAGEITWQPDVYKAAIAAARACGAKTIIDVGSGNGLKLVEVEKEFKFVFIDFGDNLKNIKANMRQPKKHEFIDQNFEKAFPKLKPELLNNAVVVCSDVIEHIVVPDQLAKGLADCMKASPFVFISTPDRLRTRGIEEYGPPANSAHVREWSLEELDWYMRQHGVKQLLAGYTRSNDYEHNRNTIVLVGGSFINEIRATPKVQKVGVAIPNSLMPQLKAEYELYYSQKELLADPAANVEWVRLHKFGFLDTPAPNLPLKSILSNAIKNQYGSIQLDVYSVTGPIKTYGDMAVNYRQHGKLVRYIGKSELNIGGRTNKLYPIKLQLIVPQPRTRWFRSQKGLLRDGGHLTDDYLLESLFSFS